MSRTWPHSTWNIGDSQIFDMNKSNLCFKEKNHKNEICSRNFVLLAFYQKCNTHKLVSLYLALLTNKSSQHIFFDHRVSKNKLGTVRAPREDTNFSHKLLQSIK